MASEETHPHQTPTHPPEEGGREPAAQVYEFGPYRLDAGRLLLTCGGEPVPLTRRAAELLLVLVRSRERVVSKDELLRLLWPDTIVEEANLSQNIYLLRKALGQTAGEQIYIETIPRRGYQFVAETRSVAAQEGLTAEPVAVPAPAHEAPPRVEAGAAWHRRLWPLLGRPRLLAAAALAGLLAVAGGLWLYGVGRTGRRAPPRSLAVLPFKSLSPDSPGAHVGLGITDTVSLRLSRLEGVSVLPTSAVFRFVEQDYDAAAVGKQLGVDAVIDGTLQQAGRQFRVGVRLLDVASGETLWAETFDTSSDDYFAVQDAISQRLVNALELKLSGSEQQMLAQRLTSDFEAYQAYLRGMYLLNRRTQETTQRGLDYFKEAVGRDPKFAQARAMLAETYLLVALYELPLMRPPEAYQLARAEARKAIEIDESTAVAHLTLANLKIFVERDMRGAERDVRRALELNPRHAMPNMRYSTLLLLRGDAEGALEAVRRAHELDRLSIPIGSALAANFYFRRSYAEALAAWDKVLELEPGSPRAILAKGLVYEQMGNYEEAFALFEQARAAAGGQGSTFWYGAYGHACAATGRTEEANRAVSELRQLMPEDTEASIWAALVLYRLGQKDEAFEALASVASADYLPLSIVSLSADPRFEELRADPAYAAVERMFGVFGPGAPAR